MEQGHVLGINFYFRKLLFFWSLLWFLFVSKFSWIIFLYFLKMYVLLKVDLGGLTLWSGCFIFSFKYAKSNRSNDHCSRNSWHIQKSNWGLLTEGNIYRGKGKVKGINKDGGGALGSCYHSQGWRDREESWKLCPTQQKLSLSREAQLPLNHMEGGGERRSKGTTFLEDLPALLPVPPTSQTQV